MPKNIRIETATDPDKDTWTTVQTCESPKPSASKGWKYRCSMSSIAATNSTASQYYRTRLDDNHGQE